METIKRPYQVEGFKKMSLAELKVEAERMTEMIAYLKEHKIKRDRLLESDLAEFERVIKEAESRQ